MLCTVVHCTSISFRQYGQDCGPPCTMPVSAATLWASTPQRPAMQPSIGEAGKTPALPRTMAAAQSGSQAVRAARQSAQQQHPRVPPPPPPHLQALRRNGLDG